jgi:hypothetical protein
MNIYDSYTKASDYLDQYIHLKLKEKIFNATKIEEERKKAKIVQNFLREVKMIEKKTENSENIVSENEIILDKEVYNFYYKTLKNNIKNLSLNSIFERSGASKLLNTKNGGQTFEKEFVAAIDALYKTALTDDCINKINKELSDKGIFSFQDAMSIGEKSANVIDTTCNIVSDNIREKIDEINNNNKKNIKSSLEDVPITVEYRAAKIDAQGLSGYGNVELVFKENINKTLEEALSIINSSTFSLKNYLNNDKSYNLKLGETFVYKSLYGALSYLGLKNKNYIDKVIFKSLNEYTRDNSKIIAEHILHLREMYELTGTGLKYKDETICLANRTVDFLVYNVPNSYEIYVVSTLDILADLFGFNTLPGTEKNLANFQNPFGDITLAKSRVKKLANSIK